MKVDVRAGETIRFNGNGSVAITMTAKSGQRARFEIEADDTINIDVPRRASTRSLVRNGITMKK